MSAVVRWLMVAQHKDRRPTAVVTAIGGLHLGDQSQGQLVDRRNSSAFAN